MGVALSWSLSKHLKIWWSLQFAFADDAVLLIYIYAASLFLLSQNIKEKKREFTNLKVSTLDWKKFHEADVTNLHPPLRPKFTLKMSYKYF